MIKITFEYNDCSKIYFYKMPITTSLMSLSQAQKYLYIKR